MPTQPRQEQIRTVGSGIDDTLDPLDHDAQAQHLRDTIDFICSQFTQVTGEVRWETLPQATIAQLADSQGFVPQDIVLTRDSEGRVETFTKGTRPTWTLTRDSQGRVTSLTDGIYIRTIVRDAQGQVERVDVTTV